MSAKPPKSPPNEGPLSEDEIKSALHSSGFPLEIRLLDAFHRHEVHAEIGARLFTDHKEASREIDLVTTMADGAEGLEFGIQGLVEAKSLPEAAAFVGFEWQRPEDRDLRRLRHQFAGHPCFAVGGLDDCEDARVRSDLAEALDPLNEPVVCYQWTSARRPDGRAATTGRGHEPEHWTAIDTLVRASAWAHSTTSYLHQASPLMLYYLPILIIGAPKLYVYDAISDGLRAVDEMLLYRDFEMQSSQVERRLVSVATESAVPALVERQERALARLKEVVGKRAVRLREIGKMQRDKLERIAISKARGDFHQRTGDD